MEKLRNNSRLVVAGLISLGILTLLISNANSDTSTTTTPETTESIVDSEDVVIKDGTTAPEATEAAPTAETEANDTVLDTTPATGEVTVEEKEGVYSATVRQGDSQTVIVRQMVTDKLAAADESLTAEQRLYAETILVNFLPRDDYIEAGEIISINNATLDEVLTSARALTDTQKALWASYL